MPEKWYVGETKPQCEARVIRHLARVEVLGFFPTQLVTRLVRGTRQDFLRPLFPRYVFVSLDLDYPSWGRVFSIEGMKKLLGGFFPEPLLPGVGETLRDLPPLVDPVTAVSTILKRGDLVKIKYGPATNMTGTVLRDQEKQRISVLMTWFDRPATPTTLRRDEVELVQITEEEHFD